jgi:hypothetical protein
MKNLVLAIMVTFGLVSCGGEEQQTAITESQAQAKIDSIYGERKNEVFMQAMEDLDRRISIEVKPKADSIVAAWKAANGQ